MIQLDNKYSREIKKLIDFDFSATRSKSKVIELSLSAKREKMMKFHKINLII